MAKGLRGQRRFVSFGVRGLWEVSTSQRDRTTPRRCLVFGVLVGIAAVLLLGSTPASASHLDLSVTPSDVWIKEPGVRLDFSPVRLPVSGRRPSDVLRHHGHRGDPKRQLLRWPDLDEGARGPAHRRRSRPRPPSGLRVPDVFRDVVTAGLDRKRDLRGRAGLDRRARSPAERGR